MPKPVPLRALFLYAALVGVPLVGLFGILQAGKQLEAPPALGGVWELSVPSRCAPAGSTMHISQSGRYLSVRFGAATLQGHLRSSMLSLQGIAETPGCGTVQVRLRAAVLEPHPTRLFGRWVVPGCPACPEASFTATRVE